MSSFIPFITVVFSLHLYAIQSIANPNKCYPNAPQCSFNEQFLLLHINNNDNDNKHTLSWDEAKNRCQSEFGESSTLAYLDPNLETSIDEQFMAMQRLCSNDNLDMFANCWIGGLRSKQEENRWDFFDADNNQIMFKLYNDMNKNNKEYHLNSNDFNFWSCDPSDPKNCEPDYRKRNYEENEENCLALYSSRGYHISDWPCNGGHGINITDIICTNPKFDATGACQCNCDLCYIHGDPHVHTFDGLLYHPMGNCSYHYVTPCFYNDFDEFFPFDITGDHHKCFNSDMSCLRSLYITLYDPQYFKETNQPSMIVVIGNELIIDQNQNSSKYWLTTAKYLKCNECKHNMLEGQIDFDKDIIFYENEENRNEPWLFRLEHFSDGRHNYIMLRFYGKSEWEQFRIEFMDVTNLDEMSLYLSEAKIYISECLLSKTCGLCGYYDHDIGGLNDFVVRVDANNNNNFDYFNGKPDFDNPLSTKGVDTLKDVLAFHRAQDFAHEWKNQYPIFLDLQPFCGKSVTCNFDDYFQLCPNSCDCQTQNGETLEIEQSGISDSCAIDVCGCVSMEPEELDEIYNIPSIFGMSSKEILQQFSFKKEEDRDILISFFRSIERMDCLNIAYRYCCSPLYCSSPLQFPLECGQSLPTEFPTPEPTTMEPTPMPSYKPSNKPSNKPINEQNTLWWSASDNNRIHNNRGNN